jgi:hypothetical protein
MASAQLIEDSAFGLLHYMENEKFLGYDPYDALKSPFWQIPLLNKAHKLQFYFQQFVKRAPLNLRSALFIDKGLNPVTLGLALQSYVAFYKSTSNKDFLLKAANLIDQLKGLSAKGYHGNCWGYDFPWSSRYVYIPAYQPTVVATSIITNALFEYWKISRDKSAEAMILSSAEFVLNDLRRSTAPEGYICFSYSPFDNEMVFNASMKGVRILAQANHIRPDSRYQQIAEKAVNWLATQQNQNGSWIYSMSKSGHRIDNYHTGYILDSLADCITYFNFTQFQKNYDLGKTFYLSSFFEADGQPRFYHNNTWPADCTAGAQAILSLLKMNETSRASQVAEWMIKNMQDESGYFYFRKYPGRLIKTSFMRWSNAWMLAALSTLNLTVSINSNNKAHTDA